MVGVLIDLLSCALRGGLAKVDGGQGYYQKKKKKKKKEEMD